MQQKKARQALTWMEERKHLSHGCAPCDLLALQVMPVLPESSGLACAAQCAHTAGRAPAAGVALPVALQSVAASSGLLSGTLAPAACTSPAVDAASAAHRAMCAPPAAASALRQSTALGAPCAACCAAPAGLGCAKLAHQQPWLVRVGRSCATLPCVGAYGCSCWQLAFCAHMVAHVAQHAVEQERTGLAPPPTGSPALLLPGPPPSWMHLQLPPALPPGSACQSEPWPASLRAAQHLRFLTSPCLAQLRSLWTGSCLCPCACQHQSPCCSFQLHLYLHLHLPLRLQLHLRWCPCLQWRTCSCPCACGFLACCSVLQLETAVPARTPGALWCWCTADTGNQCAQRAGRPCAHPQAHPQQHTPPRPLCAACGSTRSCTSPSVDSPA